MAAENGSTVWPWCVAYTKPRSEKKVHQAFIDRGFEAYCPLSRSKRRWSDRVKWIHEPVFRSYVFVRVNPTQIVNARNTPGVLTFLFQNGKPAMVRDKEIELIRQFLRDYTNVSSRPINASEKFEPGKTIEVTAGMLMGQEGIITDVRNNEAIVRITSLNQELVATIDPQILRLINPTTI